MDDELVDYPTLEEQVRANMIGEAVEPCEICTNNLLDKLKTYFSGIYHPKDRPHGTYK